MTKVAESKRDMKKKGADTHTKDCLETWFPVKQKCSFGAPKVLVTVNRVEKDEVTRTHRRQRGCSAVFKLSTRTSDLELPGGGRLHPNLCRSKLAVSHGR